MRKFFGPAVLGMCALLVGSLPVSAQTVLRFSHSDGPIGTRHESIVHFAQKVEEYTQGRYKVEVFHSGQLGPDPKALEQVRIGGIDFTNVGTIGYAALDGDISLTALPFAIDNFEHGQDFYDKSAWLKSKFDGLQSKGIRMIGTWEAGFRSFATTFPFEKPSDAGGKAIRIFANDMLRWMMEDIGFKPVVLPITDTYLAIQQGTVSGQDNSLDQLYSQRSYEVAKYITLTEHMYNPMPTAISQFTWNKLSEEDREAVMRASQDATTFSRDLAKKTLQEQIKAMEAAGATFIYPDKAIFRAAMAKTYDKARAQFGDQVDVVLGELEALRAK